MSQANCLIASLPLPCLSGIQQKGFHYKTQADYNADHQKTIEQEHLSLEVRCDVSDRQSNGFFDIDGLSGYMQDSVFIRIEPYLEHLSGMILTVIPFHFLIIKV